MIDETTPEIALPVPATIAAVIDATGYQKLLNDYDWKNPDIAAIFRARQERLIRLRAHPQSAQQFAALHRFYKDHPVEFIMDWGTTFDPRVVGAGRPALMPFILFPEQVKLVLWFLKCYRDGDSGLLDKSRDMGASWVAIAFACWLCIFGGRGIVVGFGSRTEDMVDKKGDPDSLLYKARSFLEHLPPEFRGGWHPNSSPHKRVPFPATGSLIRGSSGRDLGRGGRSNLFFVDECCHLDDDRSVDAALAANTPCRIDMSSVKGRNNSFADRRWAIGANVFTLHWRQDPRKDQAYYDKFLEKWGPVITAQELDINYGASVEGTVIPDEWVRAAIGFARKFGISTEGVRLAAYDPGDRGQDKNALCLREGIEASDLDYWSGKRSDLFQSTARAFRTADKWRVNKMIYDSAGIGGGTYAGANQLNAQRAETLQDPIKPIAFNGGAAVAYPDRRVPGMGKITNKEHYRNLKSQAWGYLAYRFEQCYKATKGEAYDAAYLISINEKMAPALLVQLTNELIQPTQKVDGSGKLIVDKTPEGQSPNLADSLCMAFSPLPLPLEIPKHWL